MANIIIVTDHCYLVCRAINHISVSAVPRDSGLLFRKKSVTKTPKGKEDLHRISIDYEPLVPGATTGGHGFIGSSKSADECCVVIEVYGEQHAVDLFKVMVRQIRDQTPDELYLDKLVDDYFTE
jgi:hypothetical protein